MPTKTLDRLSLTLLGMAACLSITIFFYAPYFFHIHGGIAFLIPYALILFSFGLPFLVLEQLLGSYLKPSLIPIFHHNQKLMKVGVSLVLIVVFLFVTQQAIYGSWALVMFLASFGEKWIPNPESFFHNNVLQQTDSFMVLGSISLPVLFGLFLTWLFVFLLIRKGIDDFRNKVGYFVYPPFILLVLIIAMTLRPPVFSRLSTFLIVDFSSLTILQTWEDAFFLSLASLLLGFIVHAFFSSLAKNGRSLFTSYATLITTLLFSLSTLYFSLVILSLSEQPLSVSSGPEFIFVTLTTAFSSHNDAQMIGGLYFGILILLTLGTIATIGMAFTNFLAKLFALKNVLAAALVTLTGLVFGTVFTSGGGYYFVVFIESFFRAFGFFLLAFFEILLFCFLWKRRKLLQQELSSYTFFLVRVLAFCIFLFLAFNLYTWAF